MASRAPRSPDVDRLLSRLEPPQRETAMALRELILKAGPNLQEVVRWGVPCYRGEGFVCSIATHSDHTNLEFYRGALLRDPRRLLEGTGKLLRHVKFYAAEDVKPGLLRPLLREAIALDAA